MAKDELGTKRVCPETGKKFYDLNKDPVVSPYTGKSYPISFFEEVAVVKVKKEPKPVKEAPEAESEDELEDDDAPEFVSLEEADDDSEDTVDDDEDIPEIPDVDIEVDDEDDDADDTFLEEEEEDDDLSDVIGGVDGEEEV
ncbi:MAG: TIGR02300 family protein [Rhizobiaceae bacterium]